MIIGIGTDIIEINRIRNTLFNSFIKNCKLIKIWFCFETEHNTNLINNKEEYYIERIFHRKYLFLLIQFIQF